MWYTRSKMYVCMYVGMHTHVRSVYVLHPHKHFANIWDTCCIKPNTFTLGSSFPFTEDLARPTTFTCNCSFVPVTMVQYAPQSVISCEQGDQKSCCQLVFWHRGVHVDLGKVVE